VIAVATNDPESTAMLEANELPPHRLLVLKALFQDYKQLEGKQVQVDDIRPAYAAVTVIEKRWAAHKARASPFARSSISSTMHYFSKTALTANLHGRKLRRLARQFETRFSFGTPKAIC